MQAHSSQCRGSWLRWPGHATEHFAKESGQPWHEEAFQRGDLEARLPDELRNRPIQVTATSHTALQGIAQVLPPGDACASAAAMFEKDIPAMGFQHPSHFM
jgi:hypothetical protein